jgi:probable phosphomutase (TIGR03848 family)
MTTLFLIRHGLTAHTGRTLYGRSPGVPLDDRGRAQATTLAERFAPVRLTAIYSSPLERCVQTVEPLAAAQRLPILERDGLLEMDAGRWTGRSLASLRRTRAWGELVGRPSVGAFPDGESFADAHRRIVADVEAIARRHRRGRVAIATHGDVVRMLVAYFSGAPLDEFQRIVADAASVSVVGLDGRLPHVLLVNDTGGLDRFGKAPAPPWDSAGRRKMRG